MKPRFRLSFSPGIASAACLLSLGLFSSSAPAVESSDPAHQTTSLNSEVVAVPAPGAVVIDGLTNDWDLSAGVWSYNTPEVVDDYSLWTHVMWDQKGVYYLARISDPDPLQNATKGVDFTRGWKGDSVQLRTIFDDKTPDEHQMHMTLYYSTAEKKPYLIVHHGGLKSTPPFDPTGPMRADLKERFGETMDAAGGRVAMTAWENGKGYNIEAFMPWSYVRLSGQPLKPGEAFVLGWETLWAKPVPAGKEPDTGAIHRLADGVKDASANRIFMFRARNSWGRAVLSDKGHLGITEAQKQLQQQRLANCLNLSTAGSIAINYALPAESAKREVTIAIDDATGKRVRNLFGQYPRSGDKITDLWDGLDDAGHPVQPGQFTATVLDHEPIKLELLSSLYNAGTPPWRTETKNVMWGSDHGAVTAVSTHGDRVVVSFAIPEAGMGMSCYRVGHGIEWSSINSASDLVVTDDFIYTFEYSMWQKKLLVSRLEINSGKLVPFVKANGEQMPSLEIILGSHGEEPDAQNSAVGSRGTLEFLNGASLAFGSNALWLAIPGDLTYKIDLKTGAILDQHPIGTLVSLRSRDGKLYGLYNDKTLWSLDGELKREKRLLNMTAMKQPGRFGVSLDGASVAVCDVATNQVFSYALKGGAPVVIGKSKSGNDRVGGPFDRNDIMLPVAADFDSQGRIWIAEGTPEIHRTSVWNADGKLADDFWGSTPYGATHGYNIEYDASRFIGKCIEFQVDYAIDLANRKSAEVPLFYHPQLARTQGTVYRIKDASGREQDFAVSAPGLNAQGSLVIFRRDARGEFVPAAGLFPPVNAATRKRPFPLSEQLGDSKEARGWVDLNGNMKVDADELIAGVTFKSIYWSAGWVRPDMTILTPDLATYTLKKIDAHGVPVYDFAKPQMVPNPIATDNKQGSTGSPIIDLAGNITNGITYHMVDGRQGAYPNLYGRHDAPAAQRGVLIAPFRTNGVVEKVPGVGSMTILQGDRGEWFMMSFDGLFVTSLFQDLKKRIIMDETLIGGESFGGHFWRVTDGPMAGKVLLQSGHTSYRIFEVKNLETLRRQTIALNVTAEDIQRGHAIAAAGLVAAPVEGPLVLSKVAKLPSVAPEASLASDAALIDGQPFTRVEEPGNPARWFKFSAVADGTDLALVWQVADDSPWKNGSDNFTHAFIGGDAVDFKLLSPSKGAIRLLGAKVNEQPQVIFFQKQAAAKENPQIYAVSNAPGSARSFDIVKVLRDARIDVKTAAGGYTVLIRVPLAQLGLDGAALPSSLKGLAGVIFSDKAGTNRATRMYWHDKATSMVNDVPTEADVQSARFGEITVKP